MEIEHFDTKYALHTIPEFVKHLNSTVQEEPYIFNTVIQRDSIPHDECSENQYPEEETKTNEPTQKNHKIIKYNKKGLPKTMYSTCGLIRSIVVNASNKVVSFSPPKCISYEEFMERNPVYNKNIIVEELVEGTMIQLFWDSYECKWEIATKSSIGGYNTNTFTKISFRDMFFDALKEMKLTLNDFNHNYCYSFVLQHPKNQIVFDIVKPQLYLLYVYCINHVFNISHDSTDDSTDDISEEIDVKVHHLFDSHDNSNKVVRLPSECKIKYPKQIGLKDNKSYNQLYDYFYTNSYDINMNYSNMGLVIYNTLTGERCKIRNPYYEHLHNMHGRQSKLLYKYLIAKSQNTVKQFMSFYQDDPEIKNKVDSFKTKIQSFTNILLIHYIDCFINKAKPLRNYPSEYKSHMYNLHNMYLKELKPNKRNVNLIETIYYVKNLHPSKLVYSLIAKTKK
jgi:hypothetical protein